VLSQAADFTETPWAFWECHAFPEKLNTFKSSGEEISPKLEMGGSVAFFSTAVLTKCF
jgi:hypothetical protein